MQLDHNEIHLCHVIFFFSVYFQYIYLCTLLTELLTKFCIYLLSVIMCVAGCVCVNVEFIPCMQCHPLTVAMLDHLTARFTPPIIALKKCSDS